MRRREPSSTSSGATYPPQLPAGPAREAARQTANGSGFPFDQPWFRDAHAAGRTLCHGCSKTSTSPRSCSAWTRVRMHGTYFRAIVAAGSAETDTARLSAAVVLSQVLLLEHKHDVYADWRPRPWLPVAPEAAPFPARDATGRRPARSELATCPISSAALPCCRSRPRPSSPGSRSLGCKSTADRWEVLRGEANDDLGRLAADLVLEACLPAARPGAKAAAGGRTDQAQPGPYAGAGAGEDLARGVSDEMIESVRGFVAGTASGTPRG